MLSFYALLIAYILGGLTLIPVLVGSFVALIFYSSPLAPPPPSSHLRSLPSDLSSTDPPSSLYRAGWITVRRTYEAVEDATYVSLVVNGYKAFMESRSRDLRKIKPKDEFFGVLKQNILFLYENEEQIDCLAAIELTLHIVSIYPSHCAEGELFVKRNAICLSPRDIDDSLNNINTSIPWFLFTKVNIDLEDWYLDLVQASQYSASSDSAKRKLLFDPDDMARLVEGIDQQPDSLSVRWLNAMLGRIFLAVYKTETLEGYIMSRIIKKLKRVKTPSILSEVKVKEVDVGSSIPYFSKPMLKNFTTDGDTSFECQLNYSGEVRITIETVATITLVNKPYSVRLVLAVKLKELEGTLLFKIKKPPSNRIWFAFTAMPRLVMNIEPIVSTRQINWTMITSPIETRIREVIMESIVVPHMDDLPFTDSAEFFHRGGIFGDSLRKDPFLKTIPIQTEGEIVLDTEVAPIGSKLPREESVSTSSTASLASAASPPESSTSSVKSSTSNFAWIDTSFTETVQNLVNSNSGGKSSEEEQARLRNVLIKRALAREKSTNSPPALHSSTFPSKQETAPVQSLNISTKPVPPPLPARPLASILSSWRQKGTTTGVTQAKEQMKRWSANILSSNGVDSSNRSDPPEISTPASVQQDPIISSIPVFTESNSAYTSKTMMSIPGIRVAAQREAVAHDSIFSDSIFPGELDTESRASMDLLAPTISSRSNSFPDSKAL